jgi:hypothetical protein
MSNDNMIKAYNVKTKEKNVPVQDAVVSRTAKGGYIAKGHDGKGNKLTALLSEANALAAIKLVLQNKIGSSLTQIQHKTGFWPVFFYFVLYPFFCNHCFIFSL